MNGLCLNQRLPMSSCAVRGRPGESAFEAAVHGGYAGTEEAFNQLMATFGQRLAALEAAVTVLRSGAVLRWVENDGHDMLFAWNNISMNIYPPEGVKVGDYVLSSGGGLGRITALGDPQTVDGVKHYRSGGIQFLDYLTCTEES